MNHLRTGAYGMAAHAALLLTINMYASADAQLAGYSAQDLATVQDARSAQLTLYMLVLLPAALVVGVALSWLRLYVWVRPVLAKFRWACWGVERCPLCWTWLQLEAVAGSVQGNKSAIVVIML